LRSDAPVTGPAAPATTWLGCIDTFKLSRSNGAALAIHRKNSAAAALQLLCVSTLRTTTIGVKIKLTPLLRATCYHSSQSWIPTAYLIIFMMPLDRRLGTSLHRQVFLLLRDEITRGEYNGAGALPKEEALCERFNVSRATVRRALENLAALGMVERRHGIGTFVRAETGVPRIGPSLNFVESLKKVVEETEVDVLSARQELAAPEVSRLLQIEPKTNLAGARSALRTRRAGDRRPKRGPGAGGAS
jgi:DNA-binding transcriptional regulator YhcF (GntR family)